MTMPPRNDATNSTVTSINRRIERRNIARTGRRAFLSALRWVCYGYVSEMRTNALLHAASLGLAVAVVVM